MCTNASGAGAIVPPVAPLEGLALCVVYGAASIGQLDLQPKQFR